MIRGRAVGCLNAAAIHCMNRAKTLLSVEGTGQRTRRVRNKAGKLRKSTKLVYGKSPSAPGEPPHVQTGRLRASVAFEVDKESLTARVGTNVKYGRYLELGTRAGIAPRPWLRRALAETAAQINAILAGIIEP